MLDAPVTDAAKPAAKRRNPVAPRLRRDPQEDFQRKPLETRRSVSNAFEAEPEEFIARRRFSGLKFRLRGGVPRSMMGRVLTVATILGCVAVGAGTLYAARTVLLHDPRLIVASSSSIQTTGNSHLTRAQMLSIFGGDVDRNILAMPLAQRRAELESLPWVEHATVMRLLPNKVRVAIIERTPIAFVRQGTHIGLVDANGVLLEMSPDVVADQHYSFPVVTGVGADDPDSTRAARMKLYKKFTDALDADGEPISKNLSEVDLSSPEDVMALIPSNGSDILVHFGDDEFLARYQRFQKNIADWKSAHPNLASVDMRYDREAVLEMKPGTGVTAAPVDAAAATPVAPAKASSAVKPAAKKSAAKKPAAKPAAKGSAKKAAAGKLAADKPAAKPAAAKTHLQTAFDVHSKQAVRP